MLKYELIGKNDDSIINIFTNRGVNPNTMLNLDESVLNSPLKMKNMKEAIELIYRHIVESDKNIIGVVDPDTDGFTSTSILYMYLTDCYPELKERFYLIIHEGKQHNIPLDKVAQIDNVGLVIAPDCSSNEEETHKKLWDQGIDVVILDHHEAEKYSKYATMVNISLDDYPNKSLSGAAVTYKFCKGFDEIYDFNFADNYLDLVVWGILGDMVPTDTPETIYLCQLGMKNIKTEFAKAMYKMKSYNIGDQVTPTAIVFYVSPLINACVRVGTQDEKNMLIKAMITKTPDLVQSTKRGAKDGDTEIIQEQAIRVLNNIKSRQGRQVDKAMKDLDTQIKENNLTDNQVIMLDTKGEFPSEFNGLIANKYLHEYKKPVLVGMDRTFGDKIVFSGSGRSDDKSMIADLKGFLNNSGLVNFAEGHASAHGFAVDENKRQELIDYFNDKLKGEVFEPIYQLDFIDDFNTMSIDRLLDITHYSTYWARGLEEPKIMLQNVPVFKGNIEISGSFDKQLIRFRSGKLQFVTFNRTTKEAQALKKNQKINLNVIGSVSINTFKGESNLQMIVDDFEIKESQKYYF